MMKIGWIVPSIFCSVYIYLFLEGYMGLPRWLSAILRICLPIQETEETWIQSLVQEDPLEEEMATHSMILACKIPWTEEPGRLQFIGSQRVEHD